MSKQSYCPTVLLVDDDPACIKYWHDKIHNETSIGVLVANSLKEGTNLLTKNINIDAVLADIFFEEKDADISNHIYDGIDFLCLCNKQRPKVLNYILSYFADDKEWHKKAKKEKIKVKRWIAKVWYKGEEVKAPWVIVERDLIRNSWEDNDIIQEKIKEMGLKPPDDLDAVTEYVRKLNLPRRTYLQSLNTAGIILKKPIEVICIQENKENIQASADCLGLLQKGVGNTVDEALEDLADIIVSQKKSLDSESNENIVGYAALVKEQLDEFIDYV